MLAKSALWRNAAACTMLRGRAALSAREDCEMTTNPAWGEAARGDRPELSVIDMAALQRAVEDLENTSMAAKLSNMLGKQIEAAGAFVPERITGMVNKASAVALKAAMKTALSSLENKPVSDSRRWHKAAAAISGAAGGAFGLAALAVELPVSTTLMLRSIADIGRAEGEDLSDPEAALACLQVFALGGRDKSEEVLESSYFAMRGVLAKTISEATRYLVQKGAADKSAPILVRFITQIAARFGIVVSQKLAAQAIPLLGAAGGAVVNYAFVEHFQTVARGHFTVRRLERKYGAPLVRGEYERLAAMARDDKKLTS
jgi:hypothetical protein